MQWKGTVLIALAGAQERRPHTIAVRAAAKHTREPHRATAHIGAVGAPLPVTLRTEVPLLGPVLVVAT